MKRPYYQPGWYTDIPNHIYHASMGLSATRAKQFLTMNGEHIAHQQANQTAPQRDRIIGSACHSLVLQPNHFDAEFLVHDELDMRRSKDRDLLLEMKIYNPGRQLISMPDYEVAKAMAARVRAHPTAGAYLDQFIAESSVFKDVAMDIDGCPELLAPLLKCRPDALPVGMPIIADLKTTMDASQSGFASQVRKLHYHLAAWHYLTVCNASEPLREATQCDRFEQFVFIAVENFAPYCVACYDLSPEMLEEGKRLWLIALKRWHSGAGDRGYPETVRTIEVGHAFNKDFV